jgi:hypothetical protein
MSPIHSIMPDDPERQEQGVGDPVQLFPESIGKLKPGALPLQQQHHLTRDMAIGENLLKSSRTLGSYRPIANHCPTQYIARDGRAPELRLGPVVLKDRLNKVESDLRALKAKLKTKEEQVRSRRNMSKSIMTAEQELRVKIERAKEELSAKEKQAAARRAKKDSMRNEWAKKQIADYERREEKRQEQAKMDSGVETVSAGAAMATSYEDDDFDIDIYGD